MHVTRKARAQRHHGCPPKSNTLKCLRSSRCHRAKCWSARRQYDPIPSTRLCVLWQMDAFIFGVDTLIANPHVARLFRNDPYSRACVRACVGTRAIFFCNCFFDFLILPTQLRPTNFCQDAIQRARNATPTAKCLASFSAPLVDRAIPLLYKITGAKRCPPRGSVISSCSCPKSHPPNSN